MLAMSQMGQNSEVAAIATHVLFYPNKAWRLKRTTSVFVPAALIQID